MGAQFFTQLSLAHLNERLFFRSALTHIAFELAQLYIAHNVGKWIPLSSAPLYPLTNFFFRLALAHFTFEQLN
jgi:hypothetical protein